MRPQRFLDRFVASASFSAFLRVMHFLPEGKQGLLQGLVPLMVAGVLCSGRLRGLQNVFAMLAAQGLAGVVPMPAEPAGYLMLPAVLLYFGVIAGVGWALDRCLWLTVTATAASDALTTVFEQYLSLFATTRAMATFQSAGQGYALSMLSIVYVALPDEYAPSASQMTLAEGASTWIRHLVHCVGGLAGRGAMLYVGGVLTQWAASGEGLLVLYLIAVYLTATPTSGKLSDCHSVLSLLCAQHAVVLLKGSLSEWISVWTLVSGVAALVAVFSPTTTTTTTTTTAEKEDVGGNDNNKNMAPPRRRREQEHVFADVCAFGVSLLLTADLERWLDGSGALEAASTYLTVFALLECLRNEDWSSSARGGSAMPAQGAVGLALAMERDLVLW
jgi:hypothetical protein